MTEDIEPTSGPITLLRHHRPSVRGSVARRPHAIPVFTIRLRENSDTLARRTVGDGSGKAAARA